MNTKQAITLDIDLLAAVGVLLLPGNQQITRLGPVQQISPNVYMQDFQDTLLPAGLLSLGAVTAVTLTAVYLLRPRKPA